MILFEIQSCSFHYGVLCDIGFCLLCFLCRYLRHITIVLSFGDSFAAGQGSKPLHIQYLQYDTPLVVALTAQPIWEHEEWLSGSPKWQSWIPSISTTHYLPKVLQSLRTRNDETA